MLSLWNSDCAYPEQLLHARELFFGVLGHDLREPLNAITLSAQLVARAPDLATACKASARIEKSARRMTRMVEDLLDFAR
ncbi:histidine kinase dimerization/phospho-acceptor domain-containing protein [Aquincola tertiaricarbonis]|uniref:histidine kinase dimerization/phospho-acceptor domain-containing protein n=1 Tax=Aquincola tertiaricarbonis TaxID=391953 RepID=UPI0018DB65E5|nr:histidine kinase dimerization/phospho-acceptor domain-containing protein [Aquincola tertiaricarbonis]